MEIEKKTNKIINKIEEKSKNKIEIHFFDEGDMKAKDPLIKDIIRNGRAIL